MIKEKIMTHFMRKELDINTKVLLLNDYAFKKVVYINKRRTFIKVENDNAKYLPHHIKKISNNRRT